MADQQAALYKYDCSNKSGIELKSLGKSRYSVYTIHVPHMCTCVIGQVYRLTSESFAYTQSMGYPLHAAALITSCFPCSYIRGHENVRSPKDWTQLPSSEFVYPLALVLMEFMYCDLSVSLQFQDSNSTDATFSHSLLE